MTSGAATHPNWGGFTTREAAEACVRALEAEGWSDLYVNFVPIHERLVDWREDR